jgi:predicted aspartyl protease
MSDAVIVVGVINDDGEPTARVVVRGPGRTLALDAVVNTGFTGDLALPARTIRTLQLEPTATLRVTLADGTTRRTTRYRAHVTLGPVARAADVVEAGEPLVGTRLVWGHDLRVACTAAGRVALAALPAP